MTAYLSQDPKMIEAYLEGKDLYAMIAQSAFNNNYSDNLENYEEFTEVMIDGEKVIAGSEKAYEKEIEDNKLIVPACYLIPTNRGEIPANQLLLTDKLQTSEGLLSIQNIISAEDTMINNHIVKNLCIITS